MLDQFKGLIGYTDEEFQDLWSSAIIVVDTNVLLNFYKYTSKESTKSLLDILKLLKESGRLWIPHHVALEYFFNYESNKFKQHEGYNLLGAELEKLKDSAAKTLRSVKSEHPYIKTDNFQFFINGLEEYNAQLQEQLKIEIDELPESEIIEEEIKSLLDGVVGESYSQDRIKLIEIEGGARYKNNVPPGFMDEADKKKNNIRTYGDIRYSQIYGDLILWNQIIDRAKDETNPSSVIFVTEEKKEDWWEKERNKVKRPHPLLIQEFINKTGKKFYMYRIESFVRYAKEYLGADISEEQMQNVTKDVEYIRKSEEDNNSELEMEYFQGIYRELDQELLDKLNLNKLMEFLTQEEKNTFKKRLDIAFSVVSDPQLADAKYRHAIDWALKASINRLEKRMSTLLSNLALKDNSVAQKYLSKLNFPENVADKGMLILEYIQEIEAILDRIHFDEIMPF
ncbi:PIN-like domain-containing protein [uncultured Rossellomorea sp.]|uniref:PIN-like domain-containing protein n=1 Tax=uncultured Rossellomorea sp. TaxID=2837549 RepID=UPI0026053198|nr:PIN-like domain-containing protein [uncultured Rossellomorea sp.]